VSATRPSDPLAEKEALLTAVLHSARTVESAIDDELAPADTGATGDADDGVVLHRAAPVEPEHVALREIQPGEDEAVEERREITLGEVDDQPAPSDEAERDQSDVATSLVEAFDEPRQPLRPPERPSAQVLGDGGSNGTPPADIGQDTAEDLAALFNAPTPWDRDPAPADTIPPPTAAEPIPSEPIAIGPTPADTIPPPTAAEPAPPSPTYDTAEDLAALFNAPTPWDRDPAAADIPSDAAVEGRDSAPDDYSDEFDTGSFRDRSGDLADATFDPAGTWDDDSRNTTYSAAEWPWVSKSGDGGFWAPPTDQSGTADVGYSATRANTPGPDTGDHGAYGTGEQPLAATERSGELPVTTPQETQQSTGGRLRTAFHELGAWTAVAQVALLAVGMLCIIQVFVLIVVSSYLSDARERGGDVAVGSLAAHAKVDGVMLPALLMFATLAFVFAAWRSVATRGSSGGSDSTRIHVLGLPLTLWPVPFAAAMLLLVILPGAPASVTAAQRITQWAMFVCAVLGVACFAAPRGLEVPTTARETTTRPRRGGTSGGGVAPSAGSTSAA
jgi:hypothetical protein